MKAIPKLLSKNKLMRDYPCLESIYLREARNRKWVWYQKCSRLMSPASIRQTTAITFKWTDMKIKRLDVLGYLKLIEHSVPVKNKHGKPHVLRAPDNTIIKHIYKRGLWSSSTFYPYAKRFIKNSEALRTLNITAPKVKSFYKVPEKNCHLLLYKNLKGSTIRDLAHKGDQNALIHLAKIFARLHQQGVFFRDLHMDNIIQQTSDDFALIDVASVSIKRSSLGISQRARNIAHSMNKKKDLAIWRLFNINYFIQTYFNETFLSKHQQSRLILILNKLLNEQIGSAHV